MSNHVSVDRRNRYKGIRDRETSLVLVCAAACSYDMFASYAFLYLLSGFAVLLVPEACWFAAMALVPMVLV
jgi:hypothetical protein